MSKKTLRWFTALALICTGVAGCSTAPQTSSDSQAKAESQPETLPEFILQLPGPPEVGSSEDKQDHQALLKLQQTRTHQECVRAATEVKISLSNYYGKPYGILTNHQVNQLTPFFEKASRYAWKYLHLAKEQWKRVRPYDAHADLHPCIRKEKSFSYPSGHSTMSRYYYEMLVVLFPDKKDVLLARSDEIAKDRTIGGVHYPTDIRDGKQLGEEIFHAVDQDQHLTEQLQQLKKKLMLH